MKLRALFRQSMFLCALLLPVSSFAAATVSIAPAGDGVFTLRAADLVNIEGLEVIVKYDTSSLKYREVVKGNFASNLFTYNPAFSSDSIKFALISTTALPADFVIATISFSRTGSAPGAITGLSATTVNSSNKTEVARSSITNPVATAETGGGGGSGKEDTNTAQNDPKDTADDPGTGGGDGGTGNGSGDGTIYGGAIAGTINLPGDVLAEQERRDQMQEQPGEQSQETAPPEIVPVAPEEGGEAPAAAAVEEPQPAAPEQETQHAAAQSVLERFRLYQGEKSVPKLSALFDPDRAAGFVQEPRILVTDGNATLTVTVGTLPGKGAPNFAFNGASYVSMKRGDDGAWQVQAKPKKNVINPSITMLVAGSMREIPLTVAPKVQVDLLKKGTVTEADFELFLKERGTPQAPKYDLNGDGKRDYQDDYIFTANYLVAEKGKGTPAAEQKKGAEVKKATDVKMTPEEKKPTAEKGAAKEKGAPKEKRPRPK